MNDERIRTRFTALLRQAMNCRPVDNVVDRCAVYDKARNALAEHLRELRPPLSAREVAQRRLELEASIEIVEQEAATIPAAGSDFVDFHHAGSSVQ